MRALQHYDSELVELTVGSRVLMLLRVKNLERYVDREALLKDETEEPPYWAHLWTGALTLARYIEERVECQDLQVLDLGCGLGLTGIVAGLKGGCVTFADKESDALVFAAANARQNGCGAFVTRPLDFTKEQLPQRFSLILGAEILYDRPTFATLTTFLAQHLAPQGVALFADARRTNTDDFYRHLEKVGLCWKREDITEREDRLPLTVGIVKIYREDHGH
ncbi:MAG: methyltransferase [Deltaproteobacteria bacterium]|nr:methyltransferase [Deltaproteobacteria bacterium]